MIAVIQRVNQAEVTVEGESLGKIGRGVLALVAVERGDTQAQADRLAERILGYRIFADAEDRMNLSVTDIGGELLLVSQFTLAADTGKGARPSFTPAAPPEEGRRLFEYFVVSMREKYPPIASGRFGANMQVSLINDGPVTFILRAPP
ncbi:MAG: D-aminoacyl-tRNA deacylase [Methylococcaceae bacterium]|nr:D-aminoacyl-tRNA deacylase [Methylococcaceae bacterium]